MNFPDERIILRIAKAVLVLYPGEVIEAVKGRPRLMEQALRRGKGYARAEKEQNRKGAAIHD